MIDMFAIEQAIMDHFEGDSGFDQCMVEAEARLIDLGGCFRSTIKPGGLLRVDQTDPRQRLFVPKIILVCVVPLEHFLHDGEPAHIHWLCVEFCKGRTKTLGNSIGHPEAQFGGALY